MLNKVMIIGNLGRDAEIRSMQSGDRVCNLSVATTERWKDKNSGEQQERTEWHRVVLFDQQLVDVAERFCTKGRKIYVEGQLQTRKWTDQAGAERYSTEVVLRRFAGRLQMLDYDGGEQRQERPATDPYLPPEDRPAGGGTPPDLDDEIPF